jgi:hypothetical protein
MHRTFAVLLTILLAFVVSVAASAGQDDEANLANHSFSARTRVSLEDYSGSDHGAGVNHVIQVRVLPDANGQLQAVPNIPSSMMINETVVYTSPDGEVWVKFPNGTPFDDDTIKGGELKTIIHPFTVAHSSLPARCDCRTVKP